MHLRNICWFGRM